MIDNADGSTSTATSPPTLSDKMAPFRALLGMPVAVQFAHATPYVQIALRTDNKGVPQTVPLSNGVIGYPAVAEPQQVIAVAVGVLRCSEDGTWLVIEEKHGVHTTREELERHGAVYRSPEQLLVGQVLMDVYVRPEMVTHISFVKSVEMFRPTREDA